MSNLLFKESLEKFLDERVERITDTMLENPEYSDLMIKYENLHFILRNDDEKKLFLDYEDVTNSLHYMKLNFTYLQGIKDGMELKKILEN